MLPIRIVDEDTLRNLFDEERVLEGVDLGIVHVVPGTPKPPGAGSNQPDGTMSQSFLYFVDHEWIAEAHVFILPDGTFGASGVPDPKMVVSNGLRYLLDPQLRPRSEV